MLRQHTHPAIAVLGSVLVAMCVTLSGCGRSPVDPLAPGDKPTGPEQPEPGGPEDPGGEDPGFPPAPGGGGTVPGPGGGGTTTPPKPPAPHVGGLRPLPKVTPTPPPGKAGGDGEDPGAARESFIDLLANFGYAAGGDGVHNVRMQIGPLLRVPGDRFHWNVSPELLQKFQFRAQNWPVPITFEQWQADAIALGQRDASFSFYVGRRALYRSILRDRYNDTGSDGELIFYKRLNRTGYMVSYRADGQIDDYGCFPASEINWRNFLPVPDAYLP